MLYFSQHHFMNIFLLLLILFATKGTRALQCYHCGTTPYMEGRPILLDALTRDSTYDENEVIVPTCNFFNASLPKQQKYVITCQPDEKGCLKGWLTQPKHPGLH